MIDKKIVLQNILLNKILRVVLKKNNTTCTKNNNIIQLNINDNVNVNEKFK